MRVVVIGAGGTIGKAIVSVLADGNEVIAASRSNPSHSVDIKDKASIERLFQGLGPVDAVVSAAEGGVFKPLGQLTDADFEQSLNDKLMGQVNLVRVAERFVRRGGVIVVTTGVLAQRPMPGSAAISLINAGLEGFVRAAALELGDRVRVVAVSPPWVSETLSAMGRDPAVGTPAAAVARAYVAALDGSAEGPIVAVGAPS